MKRDANSLSHVQGEPSAEEKEQDRLIEALKNIYRCEDRSCPYDECWPDTVTADHVHLTHSHFRLWSSAIVSNDYFHVEIDSEFTG